MGCAKLGGVDNLPKGHQPQDDSGLGIRGYQRHSCCIVQNIKINWNDLTDLTTIYFNYSLSIEKGKKQR